MSALKTTILNDLRVPKSCIKNCEHDGSILDNLEVFSSIHPGHHSKKKFISEDLCFINYTNESNSDICDSEYVAGFICKKIKLECEECHSNLIAN